MKNAIWKHHKMRIYGVFLLLLLHRTVLCVDSKAVPPSDLKENQDKAAKAVPGASQQEAPVKPADLSPEPSRHNVDLKEHKEEREPELAGETASPWTSRQLIFDDHVNLKWVKWPGKVPSGAVSIWNSFAGRWDYVCAESQCSTGFYSPNMGSYCYYSDSDKEYRTSFFSILVNEGDFEMIQWLPGSFGSIPTNSISRCSEVYVGKNNYGLGKVNPQERSLLLPYKGYEYRYDYYEVLSLYTNYHTQKISSLSFYTIEAIFNERPSQTLATSKVVNNGCRYMNKVVTLSKTTTIEQIWDIDRPTNRDATTILITQIPSFAGMSMTLSSEQTVEWREGISHVNVVTHLRNVGVNVPPNHSCDVFLQGKERTARVPFRATLSRIYHIGEQRSISIQGFFTNVQIDDVSVVTAQCQRIPNAPPCRNA